MKWLLLTVSAMVVLTVDSRGFASVHNPDNPALGPDSPRIHQKLKKILPDGLNLVKQTGELKTSQVMVHYEPRDQELPEVAHQTERGLLNLSNFQRSDLEENKMQSEMAVRIVSKCDDGGVAIGGECYWFNEELKNWDDAVLACASRGRALASPADPGAILQYAYGKYSQFYSGFWLGGSDVASEGTWVWQSGEPLGDRFPWDPENGHGEPNNANGDENCLEMRIHENRYNDIQCHYTKGYICEARSLDTCVCGSVNRVTLIVGGTTTEENEYPWQVALVGQGSTRVYCGGSLINDRWVLSAAHCTGGGVAQVLLGNHVNSQTDSAEMRVDIKRVVNHPNYSGGPTYANDFSLLELDTPLDLEAVAPHIRPVCLPNAINPSQYENVDAVVTGWGRLSTSGPQPDILQEVTVRTMSNSECNEIHTGLHQIVSSMICASKPGKGACFGDSGGPLVKDLGRYFNLIGVVSFGYGGCAHPVYPAVYARVTDAINWITSTSSSGETCSPPV